MRRRLDARHRERLALVYDELEIAGEADFERRVRDLAVALERMSVAGKEQCARHVHRQEQRTAARQLLQIEVAAM